MSDFKNRTDKKLVMFIERVSLDQDHSDVVHVRLEPVKITYYEYKPFDAGPDDTRGGEEHLVPVDQFDRFVQGKGYMNVRDWIAILAEVKKRNRV